jgi:hypothetical protein
LLDEPQAPAGLMLSWLFLGLGTLGSEKAWVSSGFGRDWTGKGSGLGCTALC